MSINYGATPIERWQNKNRHIRQFLRGWAKNKSGEYKKLRDKLLLLIDELDLKAEMCLLSEAERIAKRDAEDCLAKLRQDEESKWAQRAKVKHVQEEGSNTKYFHLIANRKIERREIFN